MPATNYVMEDFNVSNCCYYGIINSTIQNCLFQNCKVENCNGFFPWMMGDVFSGYYGPRDGFKGTLVNCESNNNTIGGYYNYTYPGFARAGAFTLFGGDGCVFENCRAKGNSIPGFSFTKIGYVGNNMGDNQNIIMRNCISENNTTLDPPPAGAGSLPGHGIVTDEMNKITIKNCILQCNEGDGVKLAGDKNLILDSVANLNDGEGFFIGGTGCTVRDSEAINNGAFGFKNTDGSNVFHGNFASSNTSGGFDGLAAANVETADTDAGRWSNVNGVTNY
ncbi:unnamed protein product [marine sediment metagenome]|uniref:Right handed beta helix domain-containing protein n=1 Tax=marine sediment metagenome TaxID=412755 RepID=X0YN38_9ZZZZ